MYDGYGFVPVTNDYWIICAILVGINFTTATNKFYVNY